MGADGKWRFEIDDSGMRYHRGGDAQFRKDHPEYARFRELERKFVDCTITDAEITEMAELRSIWSGEPKRLAERVERGNAILANVLEHDALYAQYPQLKRVRVRFGDTEDSGAWWDRQRNEIVVSDRYRQADPAFLELKLLHEIQHVIQDIEGFAGGSNPEYWEEIQNSSRAVRENDRELAQAERDAQKALEGIPPEIAKDFWYAANMMENDPEGAERLENELFEGEYADAYGDYSWAIATVRDLMERENPKRSAMDLYRSTAGEIEARDAANRRDLDAGTRKNRLPNTGDERTVFVESQRGTTSYSLDSFDEQINALLNGSLNRKNAVHIGKTPDILQRVGLNGDLPMLTTQRHLLDAMRPKNKKNHTHGLSEKQIRQLPEKIADPVMVMDSLNHESNCVVVVTDMLDPDGLPIIAIVKADGKGMFHDIEVDTNFVNSYYGRNNFADYVARSVADNAFLYINKEKATTLSAESSTQWLEQLKGYDFDTIIRKSRAKVKAQSENAKQYSIGGPGEMTDAERAEVEDLLNRTDAEADTVAGRGAWEGIGRAEITGKAREHLEVSERKLTAKIAGALDVPRQAKREFLQPIVEELTAEYMRSGTISQEVRDRLFETAWDQGRVVDQEFYDTYKEVKDYLRTTGVTLSETDRDSRDWSEFRKRAFGTVKIVNEGGLPVDTAWGELQDMAPALFPRDILNPEDMLRHMVEVGQSIRKVEKTLDEHYGSDAKYAKQMTRNDFDAAIADGIHNLWEVKRYTDERKAESAAVAAEDGETLTAEAVMALYPKLKDARKAAEKAVARNLLTKHDKEQVQRLLRHLAPGVVTGYEDALEAPEKADLKGLEGAALEVRVGNVMRGYGVELDDGAEVILAQLYGAGYAQAVAGGAPDTVKVSGNELELDKQMKKRYDQNRAAVLNQELAAVLASPFFTEADEETKAKMLDRLYDYAAEKAKKSVFAQYEAPDMVAEYAEIAQAGGSVADCVIFKTITGGIGEEPEMKNFMKADLLREWGAGDRVKELMFRHLISESHDDEITELRKVGMTTDQFLEVYAMHGQIDAQELDAVTKATQFAYWLDGQRYSTSQKTAIKNELAFMQFMPARADRYNTATGAGLDRDEAEELVEDLEALKPPEGKTSVQQIQKWRVAIDQSVDASNQLTLLKAVGMDDDSYAKCEALWGAGVAPGAYVRVKEPASQFNEDGKGSLKNEEWTKLIDSMATWNVVLPGDNTKYSLTQEQKGFLWQMLTGSKSTKNNPYSAKGGQKWLDVKEKMKEG